MRFRDGRDAQPPRGGFRRGPARQFSPAIRGRIRGGKKNRGRHQRVLDRRHRRFPRFASGEQDEKQGRAGWNTSVYGSIVRTPVRRPFAFPGDGAPTFAGHASIAGSGFENLRCQRAAPGSVPIVPRRPFLRKRTFGGHRPMFAFILQAFELCGRFRQHGSCLDTRLSSDRIAGLRCCKRRNHRASTPTAFQIRGGPRPSPRNAPCRYHKLNAPSF